MPNQSPADRDERIRHLFSELVEAAPAERARRLAALDDGALRRRVQALVEADECPDSEGDAAERIHALLAPPGRPPAPQAAPPSDHEQLLGRQIRHYAIVGILGRGGMGVVYRAVDTKLDRSVALKFLPPSLGARVAAKDRFVREAKAASALDHPNIATVYEIGETKGGRLFIAMACYEGETLNAKIARGPMAVSEALDYALQVTEGLAKAHSCSIVHRDVKPGNLIVTEDGYIKLLDFGISTLADAADGQREPVRGTPGYMSPEQVRGEAVGPRTDLWSLGVVLYEMLVGERPFEGPTRGALLHAIQAQAPEPVKAMRPEVPR